MSDFFKSCLTFTLILSLVHLPIAQAGKAKDEVDLHCSVDLYNVEHGKSTTGDQHMAYCVQADLARQAKKLETAKSIVFLAAAAVDTAMAATIFVARGIRAGGYTEISAGIALNALVWGAGVPKILQGALTVQHATGVIQSCQQACKVTSYAAAAAGIVTDVAGKSMINKTKEKYGEAKDQIVSMSTFTPLVSSIMPALMASGGAAASGAQTAMQDASGCLIGAVVNGAQGGISVSQASASNKSMKKFLEDAADVKKLSNDSVTNLTPAQINISQQNSNDHTDHGSNSPNTQAASDPCADKSGNSYLTCVGTKSPEIAAISSNTDFMDTMSKHLGGKSLGDVVKNYDGESDMNAYVANALGMRSDFVAKVAANNDKIAKDSGFNDAYHPMGYTRSSGTKPSLGGGDDLDFSKMMASMMGKLDPAASKEGKADPSELVYRQLELLPADKIEVNKDISLFARIAFRYRKNTTNLEQLNWARPENQSASAPPAAAAPQKK